MFYPDEIIEEVRERSDIVDVISNYVKLKRSGSNYVGLCPFHNEKSPSFSVSQDKQIFHCFGWSCNLKTIYNLVKVSEFFQNEKISTDLLSIIVSSYKGYLSNEVIFCFLSLSYKKLSIIL